MEGEGKENKMKNKQGGIIRLIFLIIILILLMKYFYLSFSYILNYINIFLGWVKNFFNSIF